MQLSFRMDDRAVRRLARDFPEVAGRWVGKAFRQHGQVYRREMAKRFGATLSNGRNTSDRLASRTGNLEGSIGHDVSGRTLDDLRLAMFIGDRQTIRYAVTQEGRNGQPTVIVGKPWLAIPLPPNLTPTGRSRIERPSLVKGQPGWFLTKTKSGTLLIGRKRGDGAPEWWWVLKRKVTIPPRLKYVETVRGAVLQDDRERRVGAAIKRALKEVAGTNG